MRTSPDSHDFSDMMEVVLATTSACSFSSPDCMSSGPTELCTFSLTRLSWTCSLLTLWGILLLQSPLEVWRVQEVWLPVKIETNNLLRISVFSMSVVACSNFLFIRVGILSLAFSSDQCSCRTNSCYFSHPSPVQFHLCLGFLDPISAHLDNIPIFFPSHLFLLPLPVHFFLLPQFNQKILVQFYCFLVSSDWFDMLGNGEHLCSLKKLPALFHTCVPRDSFPGDLQSDNSSDGQKFTLLKFRVLTLLSARSIFLEITNSTRAGLLEHRLPPVLTSLMMHWWASGLVTLHFWLVCPVPGSGYYPQRTPGVFWVTCSPSC